MTFSHILNRSSRWMAGLLVTTAFYFSASGPADAAIHVQATRVIYNGQAASASVAITNKSSSTYMVQTWLDTGDAKSMPENLPIAITPPLMRLAPSEEALVRMIYSGQGLPADKESLFWVNVQEIPPSVQTANTLQVAIRTRIKLFYRPSQIKMRLDEAARALQWRLDGQTLTITNPSPLHITFSQIQDQDAAGAGKQRIDVDMIAPGQTLTVPAQTLRLAAGKPLSFSYINDYGGITKVTDVALQR